MSHAPPKGNAAPTRPGAAAASKQDSGQDQREHSTDHAYMVRYRKHSGAMHVYGHYDDRREADRIAGLLRWAGAVIEVAT